MKELLVIAPGNKNSKGGIGLCVNNYSQYIEPFKVIVTRPFTSQMANNLYFPLSIVSLLFRLITDSDIKIVHIHGASKGSFYRKYILFWITHKLFTKKIIYHVHGGGYKNFYLGASPFVQKRIKYMLESVDVVICLSEQWRQFFAQTFQIKSLKVLNNMIIPPQNIKKLKNTTFQFLFLGLIGNNKGIFDLLEMLSQNKEQFEGKMILKVAGNGEIQRLQEQIKLLKLEQLVQFEGWAGVHKKEALFCSSDAFILPSYQEGLPLSILEAMSYSLPIISTNVGGIPDLINASGNGILIEPGNKGELKDAMLALMANESMYCDYSKKSIKAVVDFYPEQVLKKLFSIYHELQKTKGLLLEQD